MNHETARAVPKSEVSARVTSIPFLTIPHQSRLFVDYIAEPFSLTKYYPNVTATPLEIGPFASEVSSRYATERDKLANALLRINTAVGAGDATTKNIQRLRSADCVAVVTGQQAGLFTGPLYTIYKALSAIRLAEYLSEQGVNAVPVFWVASEDHDFDEVSHTELLSDGSLTSITYPHLGSIGGPVGQIGIDASIASALDQVAAVSPTVCDQLRSFYKVGDGFAAAFARALLDLLGAFGIIVIDPLDPAIKELSAPIYNAAIRRSPEIVHAIRSRTSELEGDGYNAQVLVEEDYFPFFWHDDEGGRISLRRMNDGRYRARGSRKEFDLSELADLAASQPERFSPGVMLRPVVQDYLLPTICYFGGSAEIAYFAQNAPAYELLERPVTPIFHRQSFTVVEPKQRRNLNKLDLQLVDLFAGAEELRLKLAQAEFWSDTGRLFEEADETIGAQLERLYRRLNDIDITLAESLQKRRQKVLYHVAALRKKTLLAQARKHEGLGRRLDHLVNSLVPNGQLQERTINVFSYISKYGPGFIDQVYEAIDLHDKGHRIVDIV